MRAILSAHIEKSQTALSEEGEEAALLELKKGLKTLLMRPDIDATQNSLILSLQNEIVKYKSFMEVLKELVESTLEEFKAKKGSIAHQVSLLYIIENALSYLQSINNKESLLILKSIAKARLKIPKEMKAYLLLEMGRGETASPSYLARRIYTTKINQQKKNKKTEDRPKPGKSPKSPDSSEPDS